MRAWQALLLAKAAGARTQASLAELQATSAVVHLQQAHALYCTGRLWASYSSLSTAGNKGAAHNSCLGARSGACAQATGVTSQAADNHGSRSGSSTGSGTGNNASNEQRMLLREFIQQSLYHPERGYFSRPRPPVSRLPEPINFRSVVGQAEYRLLLDRLYRQMGVDWLTPVEIFRPWYGRILARYMLEFRQHSLGARQPLAIVEIGGGTGTLAASILDHVRERAPDVYATMSYTTIEISSPLAQLQQQTVAQEGGHGAVFSVVRGDAASVRTWQAVQGQQPWRQRQQRRHGKQQGRQQGTERQQESQQQQQQQHCFVLAMEVLDNLPHDRVVRTGAGQPWQQTVVQATSSTADPQAAPAAPAATPSSDIAQATASQVEWREELAPLHDPLIARCAEAVLGNSSGGSSSGGSSSGGSSSGAGSSDSSSSRRASWLNKLLEFVTGGAEEARASTVFLPTGCLALLDALHTARPNHTFVAADFDALPDIALAGTNAPLVSSRDPTTNAPTDHKTLLVPWGSADIFFPTDFGSLAALYRESAQHVHLQRRKQLERDATASSGTDVVAGSGTESAAGDVAGSGHSSSTGHQSSSSSSSSSGDQNGHDRSSSNGSDGRSPDSSGGGDPSSSSSGVASGTITDSADSGSTANSDGDSSNDVTESSTNSSMDSSISDDGVASSTGSSSSTQLSSGPPTLSNAATPQSAPAITAMHMPTSEFLCGFPESKSTRTLSGWNPLLQDWPNTQIFLGSSGTAADATAAAAAAAAAAGKRPGKRRRR